MLSPGMTPLSTLSRPGRPVVKDSAMMVLTLLRSSPESVGGLWAFSCVGDWVLLGMARQMNDAAKRAPAASMRLPGRQWGHSPALISLSLVGLRCHPKRWRIFIAKVAPFLTATDKSNALSRKKPRSCRSPGKSTATSWTAEKGSSGFLIRSDLGVGSSRGGVPAAARVGLSVPDWRPFSE